MTTKAHWEAVYREKTPDEISWYRPHLEESVQLIQQAAPDRSNPDHLTEAVTYGPKF